MGHYCPSQTRLIRNIKHSLVYWRCDDTLTGFKASGFIPPASKPESTPLWLPTLTILYRSKMEQLLQKSSTESASPRI